MLMLSLPAGSVENALRSPAEGRRCGKGVDPKGGALPVSCGHVGASKARSAKQNPAGDQAPFPCPRTDRGEVTKCGGIQGQIVG